MTIKEMTRALNKASGMTGAYYYDYAGRFDISVEQAERIAARCETVTDFRRIWANEDWWAYRAA